MVLKLYGSVRSTCTRRVVVVLFEKKIPFELVEVDVPGKAHKKAEYLEIQPFGMIPYIDHDGILLYESRAICRYLEDAFPRHGPKLIPDDLKARALFEQAASIEQNNFDVHAGAALNEKVFKPRWGLPSDEKAGEQYIKDLGNKLDAYDKILEKQRYLAGNKITLADLFHLPYGAMLSVAGLSIMIDTKRPNVVRWWNDISGRASWQFVKDGDVKSVT